MNLSSPNYPLSDPPSNAYYDNYDYIFKIILVGSQGVGKSQLLNRYTNNEFDKNSKATIGVEFRAKIVIIGGKRVKAQIWDTAGEEKYRKLFRNAYYRKAAGALIVYDITRPDTFSDSVKWLKDVQGSSGEGVKILFIGNKSDLESNRRVTYEEAEETFGNLGFDVIETSALNSNNVKDAFDKLLYNIFQNEIKKPIKINVPPENIVLAQKPETKATNNKKSSTCVFKTICK